MIFKFVIRNIKKHFFLNSVKVLGLSLALTGILFIILLLKNELTYDTHFTNSENIYRLTVENNDFLGGKHFARTYNPYFVPDIKENFADVTDYVRLSPIRGGVLKSEDKFYSVNQAFECDSSFLSVFNIDLVTGNINTIFNKPHSIIISESFAEKVYGNVNAVGEILSLPSGQFYENEKVYTVTGIMKDFPKNTHFHPDVITNTYINSGNGWGWTYLLLNESSDISNLKADLMNYVSQIFGKPADKPIQVHLQRITDIHLHSDKLREIESNGNITNIYVLAISALVLLLIALSNYVNLNAGMAGFASGWLGINKIMGAPKKLAPAFHLSEGFIIIMLSVIIAAFTSFITNSYFINSYSINLLKGNVLSIILLFIAFVSVALLLSILPAIRSQITSHISGTHISEVYKLKRRNTPLRSGIIIIQYALTIALLISVMVITRQTNFSLSHSMGQQNDNIICLPTVHQQIQKQFAVFKQELLKNNTIEHVTGMQEEPGGEANDAFPFKMDSYVPEEGKYDRIGVFACDYSFPDIFKLKFLSGNTFSGNNNETIGEYIINKSAMYRLGYTNPENIIGKQFQLIFIHGGINIPDGRIIGVVDDFHLSNLKKKVEPLVMFKRESLWLGNFSISYKSGQRTEALSYIKEVWSELFPGYPFYYEDVNSMYRSIYKSELLQAKLISLFTGIAIFICTMGLLGISLLSTRIRVKEIGVRKVNGASIPNILLMLNSKFIVWVMAAFIAACPVSYYAMSLWLENFSYKVTVSWWIYAVSGIATMAIALLSVSILSYKAATRNPVEALRYE